MKRPSNDARRIAYERLVQIENGVYVSHVDRGRPDERAERQATEYVAGITRLRARLDEAIDRFITRHASRVETSIRQVLRIGTYDLLVLGTPAHAAINEAVKLARSVSRPEAARFVNGVLRNIDRNRVPIPDGVPGDVAGLATRYSHPEWIVRRWLARYGVDDTVALMNWNNARPVHSLRVNTLLTDVATVQGRLDHLGVEASASPYLDDFLRVDRLQPVIRAGLIEEGLCAVQDESAGLVVRLLDPHPGERVADLCAAPGGKAIYAAMRMRNEGSLLAFDVHERRLELVLSAAERQGASIVSGGVVDAMSVSLEDLGGHIDRVLVDAPCSGLGVMAKRADLRWKRTPGEIDQLAGLQEALLDRASTLVPIGGVLVYSTCTIEPEENSLQIQAFLSRHPEFELEPASSWLPPRVVTPEGYLATLPHLHQMDGAFGARMRRTDFQSK